MEPKIISNSGKIKKVNLNGTTYNFQVEIRELENSYKCLYVKVTMDYDPNYWENYFCLENLKKEKSVWHSFENLEDLKLFILESLDSNDVELHPEEKDKIRLNFWCYIQKRNFSTKIEFDFSLKHEIGDMAYSLGQIAEELRRIQLKADWGNNGDKKATESIEKYISQIIEENIKKSEEILISKFTAEINNINLKHKSELEALSKSKVKNYGLAMLPIFKEISSSTSSKPLGNFGTNSFDQTSKSNLSFGNPCNPSFGNIPKNNAPLFSVPNNPPALPNNGNLISTNSNLSLNPGFNIKKFQAAENNKITQTCHFSLKFCCLNPKYFIKIGIISGALSTCFSFGDLSTPNYDLEGKILTLRVLFDEKVLILYISGIKCNTLVFSRTYNSMQLQAQDVYPYYEISDGIQVHEVSQEKFKN